MNETRYAGVAQLVEQLICNQQVGGSSPSTSSTISTSEYGRFPEWPKGADCKSVVNDFGGSNPPPPTKEESTNLCSLLFCAQDKKARIRANWKSHVSWFQPSLSLRDISPEGRKPLSHFVTAPLSGEPNQPLLKGEGDRASGGGVELPIYARPRWRGKLPQSCRKAANPAPSKREPALSVAARHLSQRERTPQSLRDSSPFRGAKSASPERGGGPRQRWRGKLPQSLPDA